MRTVRLYVIRLAGDLAGAAKLALLPVEGKRAKLLVVAFPDKIAQFDRVKSSRHAFARKDEKRFWKNDRTYQISD